MNSETIKIMLIATQLALAVTTDVLYYKVKNQISLIFAITGIVFNIGLSSQVDIISCIFGLLVPFVILLPLYILNMLGAGDIKLFCAIGALTGINHVLRSIALSFMFGAVVALIIMVANRNLHSRFRKLYIYIKSCFLSMSILPYYQLNTGNDGKMHFTIPIALGTIAASIIFV